MSVRATVLASGRGWKVRDVICTNGPQDSKFEEQHAAVSIAAVTAGTFQYRTHSCAATLVPGALLLGNAGACFECGHEHAVGDRCLGFQLEPALLECVAVATPGVRHSEFTRASLPPCPESLPLLALAEVARDDADAGAFEEIVLRLAAAALTLQMQIRPPQRGPNARDEMRITDALRRIETEPQAALTLGMLAEQAGMSPYYFLRTFRRIAGITPHQHLLRTRLLRAAHRLRAGSEPITTIAFEMGFNDLSTFNRHFRRVIGTTPSKWRGG